jgi:hypothetical protein
MGELSSIFALSAPWSGIFIGQHDRRIADMKYRRHEFPIWEPDLLDRTKGFLYDPSDAASHTDVPYLLVGILLSLIRGRAGGACPLPGRVIRMAESIRRALHRSPIRCEVQNWRSGGVPPCLLQACQTRRLSELPNSISVFAAGASRLRPSVFGLPPEHAIEQNGT